MAILAIVVHLFVMQVELVLQLSEGQEVDHSQDVFSLTRFSVVLLNFYRKSITIYWLKKYTTFKKNLKKNDKGDCVNN